MFVLLKRARGWRNEMLARGELSLNEALELEDHLLSQANCLIAEGETDDAAFHEALRRLGTERELMAEFEKAHQQSQFVNFRQHLYSWSYGLCGILQRLVVFCLPGMIPIVPGLFVGAHVRDITREMLPGEPLPSMTEAVYAVIDFAGVWWPLLAWLALPLVFLPTIMRAKYLSDRYGLKISTVLADEAENLRPALFAGIIAYPIISYFFTVGLYAPFIRPISWGLV